MTTDVRLLHKHDDLGDDDYHEWWLPGDATYRDKLGRKGRGSCRWFYVRCNNPDCRAEAIVRADALYAAVTHLLGGVS